MVLKYIIILLSLFMYTNELKFEQTLRLIGNELIQTQQNQNLGTIEKYFKINALERALENLIKSKEVEINKQADDEIENKLREKKKIEKQLKLESSIFKKYLANQMGQSSFGRDFHTMRY